MKLTKIKFLISLLIFYISTSLSEAQVFSGMITSANDICAGSQATVNISGITGLTDGNYTVNYTISGSNTQTATNINNISFSSGSASFITPILSNSGSTTVTINKIGSATIGTGDNTAIFTVNSLPSALVAGDLTDTYDGTAKLASATTTSGNTVDFYDQLTGGTELVIGTTTTTNTPTQLNANTYYYYAEARNTTTGCLSATRTTVILTITAKNLNVTGLTVSSKTYDGSTSACLGGTASLLTAEAVGTGTTSDGTPYTGDVVSISGSASGNFASKNVGNNISVIVTGNSLIGAQAGNYNIVQQSGLTANITAYPLTVTAQADTKTYDGAATASTLPSITPGTLQGSDAANFIEAYDTKNVRYWKNINAIGYCNRW